MSEEQLRDAESVGARAKRAAGRQGGQAEQLDLRRKIALAHEFFAQQVGAQVLRP